MIRFTSEAAAEIAEARAWYSGQHQGLARRFTIALRDTLRGVEQFPESFPLVRGETRRALVRSFPYALYYQLDDAVVIVIACVHGARNPRVWERRLE
jgi:plasmid stabilization system protein ParE